VYARSFEDTDEVIDAARLVGMTATNVLYVSIRMYFRCLGEWRKIGNRGLGMTIVIRDMGPTDIAACRLLLSQLGYDLNEQEVKRRYKAIKKRQDHAVFVGEQDGQVVALLHLYERPAFDKPPEVIVQALVVDQKWRDSGAGKTMMNLAERWALDRGFSSVALTSSVSRSDAHSFYNKIGYKVEATSHLFRKNVVGLLAQG
jgi:GNAT superfamily N-acetyltransferase